MRIGNPRVMCLVALAMFLGGSAIGVSLPFWGKARVPLNLNGELLDFSNENGPDRRIWSPALGEKRSLYVYLPPGYDPEKPHKVLFWLHAYLQDVGWFPKNVIPMIDKLIQEGLLAPMVIIMPDANLTRKKTLGFTPATQYMDSELGQFETLIMTDIWDFIHSSFSLSENRHDHILAGASMGGGAAVRIGIRYRDRVGAAISAFGPLDLRYQDHMGRFLGNKPRGEPRTEFNRPHLPIARFAGIPIRLRQFAHPLFNLSDPDVAQQIAAQNPQDMLTDLDVKPGEIDLYISYGRFDEYNFDAQGRAFAQLARDRGLYVEEAEDRWGHHTVRTAMRLLPGSLDFINRQWGWIPTP